MVPNGTVLNATALPLKCVHELERLVKCRVHPKAWHSAGVNGCYVVTRGNQHLCFRAYGVNYKLGNYIVKVHI